MQFDDSSLSTSVTETKTQDADMKNASMASTPDEITKIKQQNEKAKEMHLLKQKYRKDEIYIYECWNCQNPLMLH